MDWNGLLAVVDVNTNGATGSVTCHQNLERTNALLAAALPSGRVHLYAYQMCPEPIMPQRDGTCRLCGATSCIEHPLHWGLARIKVANCSHHGKCRQPGSSGSSGGGGGGTGTAASTGTTRSRRSRISSSSSKTRRSSPASRQTAPASAPAAAPAAPAPAAAAATKGARHAQSSLASAEPALHPVVPGSVATAPPLPSSSSASSSASLSLPLSSSSQPHPPSSLALHAASLPQSPAEPSPSARLALFLQSAALQGGRQRQLTCCPLPPPSYSLSHPDS